MLARDQDYLWMWYADIVLASAAALINLPIKEARPVRTPGAQPAEVAARRPRRGRVPIIAA